MPTPETIPQKTAIDLLESPTQFQIVSDTKRTIATDSKSTKWLQFLILKLGNLEISIRRWLQRVPLIVLVRLSKRLI